MLHLAVAFEVPVKIHRIFIDTVHAFDAACEAFPFGLIDLDALKVHAFGHAQFG